MKRLYSLVTLVTIFSTCIPLHAQELYHQWSKSIDMPELDYSRNGGKYIKSDDEGNIYVAGGLTGAADLDPSAAETIVDDNGGDDWFLAKYDPQGNFLWGFSTGGKAIDTSYGLEIDNHGNVIVGGAFRGAMDIDPSSEVFTLTSAQGEDGTVAQSFLAKYSSDGKLIWGFCIPSEFTNSILDMTSDREGNIITTGAYRGPVEFDPSNHAGIVNGEGRYLAKYDTDGHFIWAIRISNIAGPGVHCDKDLNVFTTGSFTGTNDFDPTATVATRTSVGGRDIFVAKYSAVGEHQWSFSVGSTMDENGFDMTSDENGNVYVTGDIRSAADFNPSPTAVFTTGGPAGNTKTFVARYSGEGEFSWAFALNHNVFIAAPLNQTGRSIERGENGSFYLTGNLPSTSDTDFDPSSRVLNMQGKSFFIAQYRNDGNPLLAANFPLSTPPSTPQAYPNALFVTKNHELLVTGSYTGVFDADPLPDGTSVLSATKAMFIAKYMTCATTTIETPLANQQVCAGADLDLKVEVTSTASLAYQWFKDSAPLHGEVSNTLHIAQANITHAGNYYVEIYGGCGAVSDTVQVSLKPAPQFSDEEFSDKVCEGSEAIFSAVAGAGVYQWFKDDDAIADATTSTFTIAQALQRDEGIYHLQFTDECGVIVNSSDMPLSVTEPVAITSHPHGIGFIEGDAFELKAEVTGENIIYSWRKDDILIDGETSSTLSVTSAVSNDAGEYILTATNDCNSVDSDVITVEMLPVVIGIEEILREGIRYTNPVKDIFSFEFNTTSDKEFIHVSIYAAQGNKIYEHEVAGSTPTNVNASQWSSGFYYFVARRGIEAVAVKLVKR